MIRQLAIGTLVLCIIYFCCMHHRTQGGMLSTRRAELEKSQAEVVVIGSSICRAGIDANLMAADSGLRTLKACENGAASAWTYLYVKNILGKSKHRPNTALFLFRDHFLTDPDFRTEGCYAKQLRALSEAGGSSRFAQQSPWEWVPVEAQDWLQTRLLRRSAGLMGVHRDEQEKALAEVFSEKRMRPDWITRTQLASEQAKESSVFDFDARLGDSYLPAILDELERLGIQGVFVRMKRRRNLEPSAQSEELQSYVGNLENYLVSRGAKLIDFSEDERITLEHFGPGDHLNREGQRAFSHWLAEACTLTFMDSMSHTSTL